jgi:hypothetical protein
MSKVPEMEASHICDVEKCLRREEKEMAGRIQSEPIVLIPSMAQT